MSRSLSAISKRRKTIQTTQKITNAMKLVSMSKLQRYRRFEIGYNPIFDHVIRLPHETYESGKPKLYVAFVPDLGLVSAYPRNLLNEFKKLGKPDAYIFGSQSYDKFSSGDYCNLLSPRTISENIDLDRIKEFVSIYHNDYHIVCLVPEVSVSAKINFNVVETDKRLLKGYQMVFEPDYDSANDAFEKVFVESTLINTYYQSKVAEHTMRRVAMEQATENADNMLYDLQLQYNRLRQEKITEEIADLTQAED